MDIAQPRSAVLAELDCSPEKWPGVLLMPSSDGLPEIDVQRPKGSFRPNGPMTERAILKLEVPEPFSNGLGASGS